MPYLFIGLVVIFFIVLILSFSNKARNRKKLEEVRFQWSKPKTGDFDFDLIGKFARIEDSKDYHTLSDQTIEDIDFYNLFALVDRTVSRVGQQWLFKKLTNPTNAIDEKLNTLADLFTQDSALREEIQLELSKLQHRNAYHISSLLQEKLIEPPTWYWVTKASVVSIGLLLLLSIKYPVFLIFLVIPIAGNMLVHYWNKSNTIQFVRSFPRLSELINVSGNLVKSSNLVSDSNITESLSLLQPFQWKMKMLSNDGDGGIKDELTQLGLYFIELLKAFFLVEVFMLFHLTKELKSKREYILSLFTYVGELDLALSVASLRAGSMTTCKPLPVTNQKEFEIRGAYHPLISDCVKNDLTLNGKGILITGSNMSGKSTFLRMLAINSILAQTINTCFADEFKMPFVRQFTSIRINDNLFEGMSYYFEEVRSIKSLVDEANSQVQNLFILDEVFKGTNTVERIASAKAILSYLNQGNNLVIASTHDIELSDLLKDEFDLYHFTETIEDDQLHFDHKIKVGRLTTRNAVKILELSNYPSSVIDEARKLSSELKK
jgi:DNA mismatch repair ATPase MutS